MLGSSFVCTECKLQACYTVAQYLFSHWNQRHTYRTHRLSQKSLLGICEHKTRHKNAYKVLCFVIDALTWPVLDLYVQHPNYLPGGRHCLVAKIHYILQQLYYNTNINLSVLSLGRTDKIDAVTWTSWQMVMSKGCAWDKSWQQPQTL